MLTLLMAEVATEGEGLVVRAVALACYYRTELLRSYQLFGSFRSLF